MKLWLAGIGLLLVVLLALGGDSLLSTSALDRQIVTEIRLPRVLTALVCGVALALAGVLLQTLLQNPLADPYVLGVSGGGSVAALLAMLLGVTGGIWVGAFIGALASMVLVYHLANRGQQGFAFRLLLSGVVLAALWGAVVQMLLLASPAAKVPGMLFWLMGDISRVSIPWLTLVVTTGVTAWAFVAAGSLDVLRFGEAKAQSVGLSVARLQWQVLFASSLLVAAVVSVAGNIGFVGLVVPHIARLLGARDHRQLLPLAALLGATLLVLADWLARTLIAPVVLPIGVMTTVIGAPLFVYLLRKTYAGR